MCCEEIPSFIKRTFVERSPTENFLINFREGRCLVTGVAYISNRGICGMSNGRLLEVSSTIVSYNRPRSRTVVWGCLRLVFSC